MPRLSPLDRFCRKHSIRCHAIPAEPPAGDDWGPGATHWSVTLERGERRLTTGYHMSGAREGPPCAGDVLSSLLLDASCAVDSFETYCSDLGFDSDSRRAYASWEACRALAPRLREFLGDLYDEAEEAAHES